MKKTKKKPVKKAVKKPAKKAKKAKKVIGQPLEMTNKQMAKTLVDQREVIVSQEDEIASLNRIVVNLEEGQSKLRMDLAQARGLLRGLYETWLEREGGTNTIWSENRKTEIDRLLSSIDTYLKPAAPEVSNEEPADPGDAVPL